MAVILGESESKFLERTRVKLTNAQSHEEIKAGLLEYEMSDEEILEGQNLYVQTRDIWNLNETEQAGKKLASMAYRKSLGELTTPVMIDRENIREYCKRKPEVLVAIGLSGEFPTNFPDIEKSIHHMYSTIITNADVAKVLKRIKITPDLAEKRLAQLEMVKHDYANYVKEDGEAQASTKTKDQAIVELKEWVDEFDSLAKIVFREKPQLLEVLGIFVRS